MLGARILSDHSRAHVKRVTVETDNNATTLTSVPRIWKIAIATLNALTQPVRSPVNVTVVTKVTVSRVRMLTSVC